MEDGKAKTKGDIREHTKRGLTNSMYSDSPSQQRHGPGLRGAVHDVCGVE